MKKAFLILLFVSNAFISKSQNNFTDKQAVQMLKEFYTANAQIWNTKPVPSPKIFDGKLDSLQKKYCTQKVRKEAKEWLSDGHDLLTEDWGIDIGSLKTMTIVKDPSNENTYIVSYIVVNYPQSPVKPVMQPVFLHVALIKENEDLKIASIRDSSKLLTKSN